MKHCAECGGDMLPSKEKRGYKTYRYFICEYCAFRVSATENDFAKLEDKTSAPPKVIRNNNEY